MFVQSGRTRGAERLSDAQILDRTHVGAVGGQTDDVAASVQVHQDAVLVDDGDRRYAVQDVEDLFDGGVRTNRAYGVKFARQVLLVNALGQRWYGFRTGTAETFRPSTYGQRSDGLREEWQSARNASKVPVETRQDFGEIRHVQKVRNRRRRGRRCRTSCGTRRVVREHGYVVNASFRHLQSHFVQ